MRIQKEEQHFLSKCQILIMNSPTAAFYLLLVQYTLLNLAVSFLQGTYQGMVLKYLDFMIPGKDFLLKQKKKVQGLI